MTCSSVAIQADTVMVCSQMLIKANVTLGYDLFLVPVSYLKPKNKKSQFWLITAKLTY